VRCYILNLVNVEGTGDCFLSNLLPGWWYSVHGRSVRMVTFLHRNDGLALPESLLVTVERGKFVPVAGAVANSSELTWVVG